MAKKVSLINRKINQKIHDILAQENKDILRAMQL